MSVNVKNLVRGAYTDMYDANDTTDRLSIVAKFDGEDELVAAQALVEMILTDAFYYDVDLFRDFLKTIDKAAQAINS